MAPAELHRGQSSTSAVTLTFAPPPARSLVAGGCPPVRRFAPGAPRGRPGTSGRAARPPAGDRGASRRFHGRPRRGSPERPRRTSRRLPPLLGARGPIELHQVTHGPHG